MCDLCEYDIDLINNESLELCSTCSSRESENLLTKTESIKEYLLSSNDLEDVRKIEYKNAYKTKSYLYLKPDIEHLAIIKHDSLDNMKHKKDEKNLKSIQRKNKKLLSEQQRKNELDGYLKSIGLNGFRNDSVLCDEYLKNRTNLSKEEIGIILIEMNFYYTHTDYAQELYDNRQERYINKDHHCEEDLRDSSKHNAIIKYFENNSIDTIRRNCPQSLLAEYHTRINKIHKN